MGTSDDLILNRPERERAARVRARRPSVSAVTGGGTDGNEQLTTVTGAILIVLLAVIGFTIPLLRHLPAVARAFGIGREGREQLVGAAPGGRGTRDEP